MKPQVSRLPREPREKTVPPFPVRDDQLYCYLKARLPFPYRIEAFPSTHYFSEWNYCYVVYRHDAIVARWEGAFDPSNTGSLARTAAEFVATHGLQLQQSCAIQPDSSERSREIS